MRFKGLMFQLLDSATCVQILETLTSWWSYHILTLIKPGSKKLPYVHRKWTSKLECITTKVNVEDNKHNVKEKMQRSRHLKKEEEVVEK
jgi:hypothetical protein